MAIYERQFYSDLNENEILSRVSCEGHAPRRVIEAPGAIYGTHKNSYDLVLAFLRGSAEIRVGEKVYHCAPGDKLNIPGSLPHSAIVGSKGVVYLLTQVVSAAD
ncbi:MAG: hypothetical protein GC204_15140 [Chloroflexi bacterium]|nr:hypothetical protein [Chloroflexota bacterium]